MIVERATADDALSLAAVHVRSWQAAYAGILSAEYLGGLSIERRAEQWRLALQRAESQTLVVREAAAVVGFVGYGPWREDGAAPDHGEIWALYVHPQAWGRGCGRELLAAAKQALLAAGRGTVSLWVLSRNERALRFYEASGFRPVPGSTRRFELGGTEVEEVRLTLRHDA